MSGDPRALFSATKIEPRTAFLQLAAMRAKAALILHIPLVSVQRLYARQDVIDAFGRQLIIDAGMEPVATPHIQPGHVQIGRA